MVNKKQELIEAIDKLQESQVVKFNNRVVDLNMSLHRHELRLILKEDYQEWNDNVIDALFESLLNEDSDYDSHRWCIWRSGTLYAWPWRSQFFRE